MIAAAAAVAQRMRLVALVGGHGSGRRTLARHMERTHGFERVALEAPLRRAATEIFGLQQEVFDSAAKEAAACGPERCTSARALLLCTRQAGAAFRGSDGFLAELAERDLRARLRAGALLVVEDVATREEADVLARLGGELWRVGDGAPAWIQQLEHVPVCTHQPLAHTLEDVDVLLL